MTLITRRKVLLLKIESTYNTDAAPVPGTDAVLTEGELTWSNEGLKMIARPAVRPSLGELQHIYGGRMVTIPFVCEVKGSGAAGTAPEIGPALRACGLAETIVGGTSVTYAPVSAALESVTAYVYEDGKLIKLTGCRGSVAFTFAAGDKILANFSLTGHVTAQTDAALVTPTYDTTVPEAWIAGAFTVDGFAGVISNLNFDLANEKAMPESVNAPDGYDEVSLVARDVNGSINPLDELVATEDWLDNFETGKVMSLTTGAIGASAGNIITATLPGVYYRDVAPEDRDGIAGLGLAFGASEITTDDEFSLAFT